MSDSRNKLRHRGLLAAVALLLILPASTPTAQAQGKRIQFPRGETSATVKGTITGRDSADYLVSAKRGQTLKAKLNAADMGLYFNVVDPQSRVAINVEPAPREVREWEGTLPETRDYMITVYFVRAEARRGTSADYSLEVYLTGDGQGNGSGGGASRPTSLDYTTGGTGEYFVDDGLGNRSISRMHVVLQPDGRAKLEVNLGGDGFIIHGTWKHGNGPEIMLDITHGFSATDLKGWGTLTLRGDREFDNVGLHFESPSQGTKHRLTFTAARG